MSKKLESLRKAYQQTRAYAYNNDMKKVKYANIVKYHQEASQQLKKISQNGAFENIDQLTFYMQKFKQLQTAMKTANEKGTSMKNFTIQAQQILAQKNPNQKNTSYLNQPQPDPRLSSQPQPQRGVLQNFFQQKKSKIVPQVGFRSLLQNPPISPRNFKKRIGVNTDQIARLKMQNQELRRKLNSGGVGNGNIQQQIRRQQERIKYLQVQNQRLTRDNTKLRSQKSMTGYIAPQQTFEDVLYSPYILNPRQNDLLKITMRSSDIDTASYYNQNFNNNQMLSDGVSFNNTGNKVGVIYKDNYSQIDQRQRNPDRYSIFNMSRSHYSDMGDNSNAQRNYKISGVNDFKTVSRNKIAFFKNSGIIVRDEDIQIAYKRSQNSNLNANRIILYFNNKTNRPRQINVLYQFEQQYYRINVVQKVNQLGGLKQARQVVQVQLQGNKQDINSNIELSVLVDGHQYKLWLPIMFIKFSPPRQGNYSSSDKKSMTIYVAKIFSNENQAQKIIQNLQIKGRNQAEVWGQSAVYQGPIRMLWKQGNKIQLSTSQKWISFLSFLMLDYKQ